MPVKLEVEDVSQRFAETEALAPVSLTVQRIARETAERAVREAEIGISEIELRDRVEASRR